MNDDRLIEEIKFELSHNFSNDKDLYYNHLEKEKEKLEALNKKFNCGFIPFPLKYIIRKQELLNNI